VRALRWSASRLRPVEIISVLVLIFLLLASIVPGLFTHTGPFITNPIEAFQAPSLTHVFGTDQNGRDVFSRVIYGASTSLLIGICATALGVGLAVVLGLLGGLGPRPVDFVITRFLEVMFAFPSLLLGLIFITIFGPGVVTSTIAVGLATAPGYARIIRGQVLLARRSGYAEAAVALGRSRLRITFRHVLPNVLGPLFVLVTLGLGQTIVWASSLSFLGLGAVPPAAEWGSMLASGRAYIGNAWWLTVFPGAFIVISAIAATALGRSLQQRGREH
jgi:peptide/nickel transport system permease protein